LKKYFRSKLILTEKKEETDIEEAEIRKIVEISIFL